VSKRPNGLGLALYNTAEMLPANWRSIPRTAVANDDVYSYPVGGVVVPRTPLAMGTYMCVISTYDPFPGPFELIVYATEGSAKVTLLGRT